MNSLFKLKKKGVGLLTAHLLKKPSTGFTPSKFYSFTKTINSLSPSSVYRISKFNFSENKKEDKDKPKEPSPPKGFEKFYKRKETKVNPEKTETKPEEKATKTDKKEEEKNDEEKEEKNGDENKEENKDEESEEAKKKKEKKEEDEKDVKRVFITENSGLLFAALGLFGYILFYFSRGNKIDVKEVSVNEFNSFVEGKQIQSIEITKDKLSPTFFNVLAYLKDNKVIKLNILNHEMFIKALEAKQYEIGTPEKEFVPIKLTTAPTIDTTEDNSILPMIALGALAGLVFRLNKNWQLLAKTLKSDKSKKPSDEFSKGLGGFKGFNLFDYGKTNVKEFGAENKVNVRFKNVAGMKQAKKEIMEFVDFLKHPEKYHKLGAKIPRGALLVGPPGTGKTMLAKAVAGEAGVPFFAISGSDFVEMFVGVGAARVRDLFKKAKEKAPSIIFIDEIDAVGRKRGGKFTGGHDERDNTLNQLLVEMDGFGTESTVIVLAATNRSDILDNALLRPGRFDRQVEVSLPDRKDREDIFKIYLKKVKIDTSKSIQEYALRLSTLTPGFSGADISNLVNEAAIISARNEKEWVDSESFEQASDRIIAGLETRRLLSDKERKTVAYHECGHAVVGWFTEYSQPLVKLTIIPRSKGALGFTQFVPDDVQLRSKEHLYDLICGLLGGRMAEEKFFGQITTGASDDLQKVTGIANAMVTKYGMSSLGLTAYPSGDEEGFGRKPYSSFTENVSV